MKVYQTCDEMKIKTQLRRLQLKGKKELFMVTRHYLIIALNCTTEALELR